MNLDNFNDLLSGALTAPVYRDAAPAGIPEFVVWSRYGSATAIGDGRVCLELPLVQVDVVTQSEDSALADQVKELLSSAGLAWFEAGCGYDDEWTANRCTLQLTVD